jgi:hypothetical protein
MPAPAHQLLGGAFDKEIGRGVSHDDLIAGMRSILDENSGASNDALANHNWQYGPAIPVAEADQGLTDDPSTDDTARHQRLLALMAQDMASFGMAGSEAAFGREQQRTTPFDFFA